MLISLRQQTFHVENVYDFPITTMILGLLHCSVSGERMKECMWAEVSCGGDEDSTYKY